MRVKFGMECKHMQQVVPRIFGNPSAKFPRFGEDLRFTQWLSLLDLLRLWRLWEQVAPIIVSAPAAPMHELHRHGVENAAVVRVQRLFGFFLRPGDPTQT